MKYHIIKGSDKFYEDFIRENSFQEGENLFDIIIHNDACMNDKNLTRYTDIETLLIKSGDTFAITHNANMRLYELINECCNQNADVIIQNPTDHIEKKIINSNGENSYEQYMEDLSVKIDYEKMKNSDININEKEIAKTLLINMKYEKQTVFLLYGNTGLGKTQLVKDFTNKYSKNKKMLRIQLSNYQNIENINELIGEGALDNDLAFKLQHRNSNIILLDEFDKMPTLGYNAFFELFDERIFRNRHRSVSTNNLIIFCTSNYKSIEEIKKNLPLPIFDRINKFIKFENLSEEQIEEYIDKQINDFLSDFGYTKYKKEELERNIYYSLKELDYVYNYRNLKRKCDELFEEIHFKEICKKCKVEKK